MSSDHKFSDQRFAPSSKSEETELQLSTGIVILRVVNSEEPYSAVYKKGVISLNRGYTDLVDGDLETRLGYETDEALRMMMGHELVHERYARSSKEKKEELKDTVARKWDLVVPFVTELMKDQTYRITILESTRAKLKRDPNLRTRSISVNGAIFLIDLNIVTNELLAFGSISEIIRPERIIELAKLNPTRRDINREELGRLATLAVGTIRNFYDENFAKDIYKDLFADTLIAVEESKKLVRGLG